MGPQCFYCYDLDKENTKKNSGPLGYGILNLKKIGQRPKWVELPQE